MKITKQRLKEIIKEEIKSTVREKLSLETGRDYLGEEQNDGTPPSTGTPAETMSASDYRKAGMARFKTGASKPGIDPKERHALAIVTKKMEDAAAAGDIKTGTPARLLKNFVKVLDAIAAKAKPTGDK